ncbi:MAG: phage portal protein [Candidatus Pacearchaeota archaeon]|jgi:HK97 family phage portal protein
MGIFTKLFEKRSFDNQQWIKDWLRGADYGNETFSGINITENKALKYSAILAASRILSEGIAGVPLFLYKYVGEGKEKALKHSLYSILHMRPNSEMTSFTFRELMMLHLIFWGNFYAEIKRNKGMDITSLWPLLPWKMEVKRENGNLIYKYKLPDSKDKIIPKKNLLHIAGISFDGLVGKSLISLAREAIGLGMGLEEFGARFFGSGAQFGGFIEHPKTLGSKAHENLRASLKEKYTGISNAHKIMILEEGMKYSKNMIPLNDAQFLDSRKFQILEIARIFNISPHLLRDLDRATFNNIEEMGIEHVIYTLRPWCVRIEQSETIQLLDPADINQYFIEHELKGLLRGDIKTRYEAYNTARNGGWMNGDEIRALENMNPMPDDLGKKYWTPLNMMESGSSMIPPQTPPPQNQVSKSKVELRARRSATLKSRIANNYRGLFEETASRIIKLEKTGILKAAKSIFKKRNIDILNFTEFLEEFYEKKYGEINKRSRPVIDTYGKVIFGAALEEIGAELDKAKLEKFMEEYTEAFNKRYIATSKSRLNKTVADAAERELDLYNEVENKFKEWEQTRPQTVSLKETVKIAGAVSLFTYGLGGVQRLIWINMGSKSCPFCEELDGKVVGIDQPFKNKTDLMEAEGRDPLTFPSNISHPPLHGGCVCMISAG